MERGELGTNRDGWFYWALVVKQGQEEPPLPSDGEGEEHDEVPTCWTARKKKRARKTVVATLLQEE